MAKNHSGLRDAQRGGFQTGAFPDLDLSLLFCPFCPFWDFPDFSGNFSGLSGDCPGIFPVCPFPHSRRINMRGTVRTGSATQSGPFPKKMGTPPHLACPKIIEVPQGAAPKGPAILLLQLFRPFL